ncbi:MAG: aquaporin family protein [Rubripirellula sp.]|nr:aquaporin family protein [Rubripirellula sp.]
MHPFVAEFVGTFMLVLFGNGVVANVLLAKTKGYDAGWLVIAAGWGIAVFIGALCCNDVTGAHINPAVTVAMTLEGQLDLVSAGGYIVAQMIGACLGAVLVYVFYRQHFLVTEDADSKLACFCTAPAIRSLPQAFFCEAIGTFALILPIFLMVDPSLVQGEEPFKLGLGSIGFLPVGLLVFGIGLSLGGTTGYAINPARDLGPRLAHAILPIKGKRDSDWSYSWVPVAGPITGAVLAVAAHRILQLI